MFRILKEGTLLEPELLDVPFVFFFIGMGLDFLMVSINCFFFFASHSVDTVSSPFWDGDLFVSHIQYRSCSQSFCSASCDSSTDGVETRAVHKTIVTHKQSFFLHHFSFSNCGDGYREFAPGIGRYFNCGAGIDERM